MRTKQAYSCLNLGILADLLLVLCRMDEQSQKILYQPFRSKRIKYIFILIYKR